MLSGKKRTLLCKVSRETEATEPVLASAIILNFVSTVSAVSSFQLRGAVPTPLTCVSIELPRSS